MQFPGLEQFSRHFPDLRTPTGRAGLALRAVGFFIITTIFFVVSDSLIPDWQPDGKIIVMTIGFLALARYFTQKRSVQVRKEIRLTGKPSCALRYPGWRSSSRSLLLVRTCPDFPSPKCGGKTCCTCWACIWYWSVPD